ncbi:MAG: HEPN family nuclease [Fusobacteriaceae bacterium]
MYKGKFSDTILERTKYIIEEYDGNYEVTLLINCTLSLICLPIEDSQNDPRNIKSW